MSDGGVLGGDLTVVTRSIRWTGNLLDRADVVACGGAGLARGQTATTSRGAWWRNWFGQQLSEELGGPITADLSQICRSEGVEGIWSEKPAWGLVDN